MQKRYLLKFNIINVISFKVVCLLFSFVCSTVSKMFNLLSQERNLISDMSKCKYGYLECRKLVARDHGEAMHDV